MDSNDYSVHPSVIGRTVEVAAGLEEVTVTCGGRQVARHHRCWAAHQSITDPAHAAAAGAAAPGPPAGHRPARRIRPSQQRALADYDQILGTGDQGAA